MRAFVFPGQGSQKVGMGVELAEASGMTLAGFSRRTSLNVYAGQQRVAVPAPAAG